MLARCCAGITPILFCADASFALPTILIGNDYSLLRVTDGSVETFAIPDILRAAAFDPVANAIFGLGAEGSGGSVPMYRVENPETGDPVLSPFATLTHFYGSITKIGPDFFGTSEGRLYRIDVSDPASPIESLVGTHGLTNTGGLAYDRDTGLLYITSSDTDLLYQIDPATAQTTPVGAVGIDMLWTGMEWWDGVLYSAVHNASSDRFELGVISPTTGAYSSILELGDLVSPAAVSVSVIPEPQSWIGVLAVVFLLRSQATFRRQK